MSTIQIDTTWVKPPRLIGGLDHLAVQAPCISIYGKLLPGITNVTDRARYYSFYPWIVWALEKEGHLFNDQFIDLFHLLHQVVDLYLEGYQLAQEVLGVNVDGEQNYQFWQKIRKK